MGDKETEVRSDFCVSKGWELFYLKVKERITLLSVSLKERIMCSG